MLVQNLRALSAHYVRKMKSKFKKAFSEKKSAFAERNIRSLKNLIYKYLEDKWTFSYINQLQSFVQTTNSRVNRVTKLAPNKVTKKDVPYLISLIFNDSANLVRRPKFYVGDFVRISKADLPFRKGYKQTFTNEVFEIYDIPTTNPPTYSLIDASLESVKGKFYELELVKVRDNSSEITKHEGIHGSLSFISLYEYFSSKHLVLIQKLFQ